MHPASAPQQELGIDGRKFALDTATRLEGSDSLEIWEGSKEVSSEDTSDVVSSDINNGGNLSNFTF